LVVSPKLDILKEEAGQQRLQREELDEELHKLRARSFMEDGIPSRFLFVKLFDRLPLAGSLLFQ
jgi:hypothetical protein